jgi:hypothetical protein
MTAPLRARLNASDPTSCQWSRSRKSHILGCDSVRDPSSARYLPSADTQEISKSTGPLSGTRPSAIPVATVLCIFDFTKPRLLPVQQSR